MLNKVTIGKVMAFAFCGLPCLITMIVRLLFRILFLISYGYAIGNPHLIAYLYDDITDTHGKPFPDTGGDWVYMQTPGSSTYITISKINNRIINIAELVSEELKMLDEKFIPYTIQRVGSDVILNSSTSGSTKKFKITVDDSGKISATEVTE